MKIKAELKPKLELIENESIQEPEHKKRAIEMIEKHQKYVVLSFHKGYYHISSSNFSDAEKIAIFELFKHDILREFYE